MYSLSRRLGIAARGPIGLLHGIVEITRAGARLSYYRGRYPGVRFEWGAIADEQCEFEAPITLLQNARVFGCSIGRYTYLGQDAEVDTAQIGRFCSIGPQVIVGLASHPMGDNLSTSPLFYEGRSVSTKQTFADSVEFL